MIRFLHSFTVIFVALSAHTPTYATTRLSIKQEIIAQSQHTSLPVDLALAVAKVESDFNADALSSTGARGVMQIMPATARRVFNVHPDDLWDRTLNIKLSLQFLEQLHARYDGDWARALSHYVGGPLHGDHLHDHTQDYIAKIATWRKVYREQAELWSPRIQ